MGVKSDLSPSAKSLSFSTYCMMIMESRASRECDLRGRLGSGREGVGRVWGGREVGGFRL